jgi:mono/diheme cytochrome c family protein
MASRHVGALFGVALLALLVLPTGSADSSDFEKDVLPVFVERCIVCHGASSPQKGLDLRTVSSIRKGSESGAVIEPSHPEESLLLTKIATGSMPPGEMKLGLQEIESIRRWIANIGAPTIGSAAHSKRQITERDVLPIIQAGCLACHGKRKQEAGLDLRTRDSMLAGGKSGPAIVLGRPAESLLIERLEAREMPPLKKIHEASVKSPTVAEVTVLKQWIKAGAPPIPTEAPAVHFSISQRERDHWSFLSPRRPMVPEVRDRHLVRNAIDAFLLSKLEKRGLTYSPSADKLKLQRRLHLDVTGMPPTPHEVEAFLRDKKSDAYAREVDRLLASSAYGERWARHWLDLAGYSDSRGVGFEDKIRPHAWRFRDYVIRSLNTDKPYQQFLTEQLAGDEQADYTQEPVTQQLIDRLAATGFLRTTPDSTYEPEFAYIPERMNVIANTVQVVSSAVMGLTMGCARCHDHKYDPISQRDYYRFAAIFQTAYDPYDWRVPKERLLDIALDEEKAVAAAHNSPIEAEISLLEESIKQIEKPYRDRLLMQRIESLPMPERMKLKELVNTSENEWTTEQKELAHKYQDEFDITRVALTQAFDELRDAVRPLIEELNKKVASLKARPAIRALVDTGGVPSTHYLLNRGEPLAPLEPVAPGVPVLFEGLVAPYSVQRPQTETSTSGRRLALARWLTQPNHPLTWRVIANQIWTRRFGRGLVKNPSNFGRSTPAPMHAELLDWLAVELVENGGRLKHIHRLMLTSMAYRQSSGRQNKLTQVDPENSLLGRMPLRRMDAEQLYDSLLKVTERVSSEPFGLPAHVQLNENNEVVAKATGNSFRRSIYVLQRRTSRVTLMDAYDLPYMTPNCLERRESTVSTQALHMMNGEPVWNHAKHLAGRIIDRVGPGSDARHQIREVFLSILSRHPTNTEIEKSAETIAELRKHWPSRLVDDGLLAPREWAARWLSLAGFAHTLLNSAEFVYID